MASLKSRPCSIPLCPFLRARNSYVCVAHRDSLQGAPRKEAKRHKFGAIPTTVAGIRFDSKAEATRHQALLLMAKGGIIADLELQPVFVLHVNGTVIGEARMDFRYRYVASGKVVVEDVKGKDLPLSRWKRKHTEAEYGITVELVR